MKQIPEQIVKLDLIDEDPHNPNSMTEEQLEGLDTVMEIANVTDLVLNQKGKRYKIIDGHQRMKIVRLKGEKEVLAKVIKVSEEKAMILQQALNKLRGTHDKEKDARIFKILYEKNMLELLSKVTAIPLDNFKLSIDRFYDIGISKEEDEEIPQVPKSTKTKYGDIYKLGNHRVMCGDCTISEDVDKLFQGKKADQLNCDPPYGVKYPEKNKYLNTIAFAKRIEIPIENDDNKEYREFFAKFLKITPLKIPNTCYIFSAGMRLHELRMAIEDEGYTWGDYLCWIKDNHVFGRKDYQPKTEFILYGWKTKHEFYGGFQTNIIEEKKPRINDLHPTSKPVALIAKLIIHGTKGGGLIYDPFGGSGSTLIAAEETGRVCYTMEKIPHYIDVIVKRWEEKTGKKAVKL